MGPHTLATTMLMVYPEKTPFDTDPPLMNLTPPNVLDDESAHDMPESIAKAQAHEAMSDASGPSYRNPLIAHVGGTLYPALAFTSYVHPPPLPKFVTEEPIEFLERLHYDGPYPYVEPLHPYGTSHIFKVRIGDDVRVLKVFTDRYRDEEDDEDLTGISMLRFRKESEAYAHLLHYGVDETGVVPHCYGWFDLKDEDVERASAFPPIEHEGEDDVQPLTITMRPSKGILLEYFPDAMVLTSDNFTPKIADTALRALCRIHTAYIKHREIEQKNILLLPDGRVVWISFDSAVCAWERNQHYKINRRDLFDELSEGWSLIYSEIVCT